MLGVATKDWLAPLLTVIGVDGEIDPFALLAGVMTYVGMFTQLTAIPMILAVAVFAPWAIEQV